MFLRGRELGTTPIRITRGFSQADVRIENYDWATLNGREVSIAQLQRRLAGINSDACRVVLYKSGVTVEFVLDIRVASERDLEGVEDRFKVTSCGRRLDIRAVEEFISSTSQFQTALGYCDGICAYLYGVLAKERAADSSLPYEAYVGKFSKAAEELSVYDRQLARTIGSLVEFHFNHYREASRLSPDSRVARVAGRYADWVASRGQNPMPWMTPDLSLSRLEALATDWETERILRWGSRSLPDLLKEVEDIESFLDSGLAEFDRVKLHILLGELHAYDGKVGRAMEHAKALRNLPVLEGWAESMIRELSED
jgi:hypothetical protein